MKKIPKQRKAKSWGYLKFLVFSLTWLLFSWSSEINAQNIITGEYFFDVDPGFGSGTPVSVNPAPNIENLNVNVDISALTPGFHYINFRFKDDSGNWSHTNMKYFYKVSALPTLTNIVAVEYFFDNDPGFGNGVAVNITPSTHIDDLSFAADITALTGGFHYFYIRVKDEYGKWSLIQSKVFLKGQAPATLPEIVKAEYFIDTDPGFGNGTDIPLTAGTNIDNLNYIIDITGFSSGFHTLYNRVKDTYGKWSLTSAIPFYKEVLVQELPKITHVEYFIDSDPGFGQGTPVTIAPGVNKTVNWVVNIATLTPGFHSLFTRVKDSLSHWSLTSVRPFFKEVIPVQLAKIRKVEYFIDTDPGFGQAVDVPFSQDSSSIDLGFNIDINALAQGFHQLFIRTKDSRGKWSLTLVRPFFKQITYDTLPNLVQIEYFYDTDPGFGNGIQVPFTPAPQVPFLAWSLNLTGVDFGQHQLYIRTKDTHGKWSLAARDTIFYYLDSLPTASMSGPTAICINSTGEFDITLTGTPPWTVIYNTGEEIDTATGIMVNPFTFTVAPVTPGPHTAQVLKVQDVYYTGLYTGIPIEYTVDPLPAAAGTLMGPDNVCSGTGEIWYWVYPVANASSYNWSVPEGAVIVSNPYSSSILVDFTHVTGSGAVSVTPLNNCGSGTTSSIYVNLRPLPVVDAGPDLYLPYGGSDTLTPTVLGGTEPYNYYWWPWYYLDNAYIQNPVASPPSTMTFSLQVTDIYGCSSGDQVTVYVGIPEGTIVTGNFSYDNNVGTALNNSYVWVKQGNNIIASDTTDAAGDFMLTGIPAGNYYLTGNSDKAWGGCNATDALLVLRHYVEFITLTGLRLGAADVTASYGINASDAFLIAKRYTSLATSFPSGDWYSETKYFSAAPVGTLNENLTAICFGDVDGSFIPEAKLSNGVEITNEGQLTVSPGELFDIPLLATGELEVGALSLTLDIPDNVQITSVRSGKGAETGNLLYNVVGKQLKIAWYSLNPDQLHAGDAILWITVRPNREGEFTWVSADGSSVANGMGQTMESVTFRMPKLSVVIPGFSMGDNYPNPFSTNTLISFNLPEDGNVELVVYTTVGQEIRTLLRHENMIQGNHTVLFEANDLPAGIYYYTLRYQSKNNNILQTSKMVIQK